MYVKCHMFKMCQCNSHCPLEYPTWDCGLMFSGRPICSSVWWIWIISFLFYFSAQYFGAVIILMAMSTAMTVVIVNIYHRGILGQNISPFMRFLVFNILARAVFMKETVDKQLHKDGKKDNKISMRVCYACCFCYLCCFSRRNIFCSVEGHFGRV